MKGSETPRPVLLGGSLEIREHSSLIFTEAQRDSGPDPRSHSWFWNWTPGLSMPSRALSDTGVPKSQGLASLTPLVPLVSSLPLEPPEVQVTPQPDRWLHGETHWLRRAQPETEGPPHSPFSLFSP